MGSAGASPALVTGATESTDEVGITLTGRSLSLAGCATRLSIEDSDWSSDAGANNDALLPPSGIPVLTGGASGSEGGVADFTETADTVTCASGIIVGMALLIAGVGIADVVATNLGSGVSTCGGSKITKDEI